MPFLFSNLRLVLIGCLCALLAPVAAAQTGTSKTYTVGVYQNAPKISGGNGTPVIGFFPEVLVIIAESKNFNIRYVPCSWAECLQLLEAGDIQIMPDVAWTPDREERFAFGREAALHSWSSVYTKPDRRVELLADLTGMTIAVLEDSQQYNALEKMRDDGTADFQLIATRSHQESFEFVKKGRADGAVVNNFLGAALAPKFGLEHRDLIIAPASLYFAYPPGFSRAIISAMDAELARLKGDPNSYYYASKDRWLTPDLSPAIPTWVWWTLGGVGGLLTVSVIGLVVMRKVVHRQTYDVLESKARFRDFAQISSDFLWETDANLTFSYISPRFSEVTGLPPETFLGKSWQAFEATLDESPPDQAFLEGLAAEQSFQGLLVALTLSPEETRWILFNGRPSYGEDGTLKGYRGSGTDITDLHLARRAVAENLDRIRRAAESAAIGVWEWDMRTDTLIWDDRVFELYGVTPENFSGTVGDWQQRVHPDDLPKVEEKINAAIQSGELLDAQFRIVTPAGAERHIRAKAEIYLGEDDQPERIIGINEDFTQLVHATTALAVAKREAEAANKAKSDFLTTMSHELRTPLNAILGFSQMVMLQYRGPLGDPKYLEHITDIHDSGTHLLSLINDMLDIAAIEAGRRHFHMEPVNLGKVLTDCEANMASTAQKAGIELRLALENQLPVLWADRRSIKQVVLNLLSNALKFTDRGGRVVLSAGPDGSGVFVRVADTGVGIDPEILPRITEPFIQTLDDPYKAQEGTGLGLHIVQTLIAEHEGRLQIDSDPGTGTVVTVYFPASRIVSAPHGDTPDLFAGHG